MNETRRAYQTSMRAIGAYLDQKPPGRVRVIEVPEGSRFIGLAVRRITIFSGFICPSTSYSNGARN
jgi:hypothetical protein